jgi:hypothetical protein
VLLLLVLMLVTTAPRDVSDDGQRYPCIEEPLGGLNPLSSDATDACVQASWTTIAFALLGSVALVTAEYVVLRGRASRSWSLSATGIAPLSTERGDAGGRVGPVGLEPTTYGLKVRSGSWCHA